MTDRIVVEGGKLVQFTEAAPLEGPAAYYNGYSSTYWIEFQLTTLDGKPATGDYRGPGRVAKGEDGRMYALLGDPNKTTWIHEYVVAEKATAESLTAFDEYRAGFAAGVEGKRKKRNADPFGAWMTGHTEGRKQAKARAA